MSVTFLSCSSQRPNFLQCHPVVAGTVIHDTVHRILGVCTLDTTAVSKLRRRREGTVGIRCHETCQSVFCTPALHTHCQKLVSWSLTSLFSTNMAISETTHCQKLPPLGWIIIIRRGSCTNCGRRIIHSI